jgi:hypothetical protein
MGAAGRRLNFCPGVRWYTLPYGCQEESEKEKDEFEEPSGTKRREEVSRQKGAAQKEGRGEYAQECPERNEAGQGEQAAGFRIFPFR